MFRTRSGVTLAARVVAGLMFAFCSSASGTTYYISNAGNDGAAGTSTSTPWETITKLNASWGSINAGDSVLFRCGDTFTGSIVVGKSGSSGARITIGSYGAGDQPVISGFSTLTSWTNTAPNIWRAAVPTTKTDLNMLTLNGVAQRMGRWPNYGTSNGGWLTYESSTFNGSTGSLTDNQLSGLTNANWTGAIAVCRKWSWIIDRCPITSQSGNTLYVNNPPGLYYNYNTFLNGFGYFIQDDIRTLDVNGEWFFNNSTKDLSIYLTSDPAGNVVKIATEDAVVVLNGKSYVTVENLTLEGGQTYGIRSASSVGNITIRNCVIRFIGYWGINFTGSSVLIQGNLLSDVLSDGMFLTGNMTITGNTLRNIGAMEGMGGDCDDQYEGMCLEGDSGFNCSSNVLDRIGLNGIKFHGSHITIKNNFIQNVCVSKNDGGAIYTWDINGTALRSDRTISGNVVVNCTNLLYGMTASYQNDGVRGIYMDGGANNVLVLSNTVANISYGDGLFYSNGSNITTVGNLVYNCLEQMSLQMFPEVATASGCLGVNLLTYSNCFFSTSSAQNDWFFWTGWLNYPVPTTIQNAIKALGQFDYNYYANKVNAFDWYYHADNYNNFNDPPSMQLAGWQAYTGYDTHSVAIQAGTPAFHYNPTAVPTNVVFAGLSKKDYRGNVYNNSLTLQPYTSTLLFDNGVAINLPAAPSGLTATAVATNRIELVWTDNATNETGYVIDRSLDSNTWSQLALAGANATNLSDIGLATNRLYYYRVAASNASGLSAYAHASARTWSAYEAWCRACFTSEQLTNSAISGEAADPDHDNFTNLKEFLAGTHPTNALSCLVISSLTYVPAAPEEIILTWQSATGRIYTLQAATNLIAGFGDLTNGISAAPPENVYTDSVGTLGQRFYRVKLETGN